MDHPALDNPGFTVFPDVLKDQCRYPQGQTVQDRGTRVFPNIKEYVPDETVQHSRMVVFKPPPSPMYHNHEQNIYMYQQVLEILITYN